MASQTLESIVLQNEGEVPSGFPVTLNQDGISIDTSTLPFTSLLILPQVLPALRIAPDEHTLSVDYKIVIDDTSNVGQNVTSISNYELYLTSLGGPTTTLTSGDVSIHDNASSAVSTLTSDYLSLKYDGLNTSYYPSLIDCDNHFNFTFDNHESFMKQQNPFAFRTYELNQDEHIKKFMPFVLIALNVQNIRIGTLGEYLDYGGGEGWSCIVSNLNDYDISIIPDDSTESYSHANQILSYINIKKFATCRITLVYYSSATKHYWAVSSY
jgi:hypothetical protein